MTDNLMTSMNVVFPLFLIMALGYVLRHTGVTTAAFNEIAAKLCFKVVLPVSIFNSIVSAGIKNAVNPRLSFWAVALFLLITAVSFVPTMLVSREPAKRGVLLQCAVRSNFVYIGLPIVENLFGSDGNAVAAGILPVIVIVYNVAAVVGENRKSICAPLRAAYSRTRSSSAQPPACSIASPGFRCRFWHRIPCHPSAEWRSRWRFCRWAAILNGRLSAKTSGISLLARLCATLSPRSSP